MIGINIQESQRKVGSFVKKNDINYSVVLDSEADVAILYGVSGIPLNIVLNKDGVIEYRENEMPGRDVLENVLIN